MERVADYRELAGRLSGQLRRGVRTNCFLTPDQLRQAVAEGDLWTQEAPGGLLLLLQRPGHRRLYFYLTDLTRDLPVLSGPVVTEVAFRERDAGLRETAEYLQAQGFSAVLRRCRLRRPAGPLPQGAAPLTALGPDRAEEAKALLTACFPPLTGCLPTLEELREDLSHGFVLAQEDAQGLSGLLHFSQSGRGGEIRHLAVRPDCRGQGRAEELICAYLLAAEGAATVWTGADNGPALSAYRRTGFVPDGWTSVVLARSPATMPEQRSAVL